MIDPKIKKLIKDLYVVYEQSYLDRDLGMQKTCTSCFAFCGLDDKLKHTDDCAVSVMKKRILEVTK